jgi:thioredoxin reductase
VKVAVVGAGAAGLVAARELLRAHHEVTVFEQSSRVGGIWVYQGESEPDLLGQTGPRLHASMYASLRTNLPRDLMAFFDFPFDASGGGVDEWSRYPGHAQVLSYLEKFAETFDISRLIRFNTKVVKTVYTDQWKLTFDTFQGEVTEKFDALTVCNGHYSEPRVPDVPGLSHFPASVMHSHNYRSPDMFAGMKVAIAGTASSGTDLANEISTVAEQVYWCGREPAVLAHKTAHIKNVIACGPVSHLMEDARIEVGNNKCVGPVDCLIFATGYHYRFPFLSEKLIHVRDNWVTPLYQDLLCIRQPTLALMALPFKIIPFPIFEIQARWFARMLNKKFHLPTVSQMFGAQDARAKTLRTAGILQRNYHALDDEYEYYDRLAEECGDLPLPNWYRKLGQAARQHAQRWPGSFRDNFLDTHGAPTRYPRS